MVEKLDGNNLFDLPTFRSIIMDELSAKGYTAKVPSEAPMTLHVLINNIRIRNTFNAVAWGIMAGNDSIKGTVRVIDASGATVDHFYVQTSYGLGGAGGGIGGIRLGWLYESFAEEIVEHFDRLPETTTKVQSKDPLQAKDSPSRSGGINGHFSN